VFLSRVHRATLILAHGGANHAPWNGQPEPPSCPSLMWRNLPWPPIPLMNERFRDIIVSVLRKGWPSLKMVEIHGVGGAVLVGLEQETKQFDLIMDETVEPC
jgi:hypothetical protein